MSVSKTANGRWRAFVKSGRRVVATRTFDLKRDADTWHDAQRRLLDLGEFVDPRAGKEALLPALRRWMDARTGTVAGSTQKADRGRLQYIPIGLGNMPVSKVRTADLQSLFDALIKRGLSPASVTRVRALLSSFYGWAKMQGIASGNPVVGSKVATGTATQEKDEVFPFTPDELREVVAEITLRSPDLGPLALVLGFTGLRWGELAALRVRDVAEAPRPAFIVSRSAPDGQEVRNRTKGGKGRSVPLTAELIPLVKRWAKGKQPDDLLFTSAEGYRLSNANWRRSVGWSTSCRGRRIHDLRHTAATMWLSNGLDPKTVQTWLGHATAQLTHDLYSHWMGNVADAASIAKIDAVLSQGYAGGTRAHS